MEQSEKTEKLNCKKGMQSLGMALIVWAIIQLDAAAVIIPNQIAALGLTPIVWGIGAACLFMEMKKKNGEDLLYANTSFSGRDGLTLFFAAAGGIAMAAGNYLYAGLSPLFIRELCTGYLLYTIRNIIYYPLEVLLMLMLLVYSQKAGELLTGKNTLPWGALALFLLWGLPHLLWHGFADGMVSALRAFIYAVPFYATGKNIKASYVGMLILWFL